jgi:DnaJ domain
MKEYYKILQVPFWASDEEVKKAYRTLVQEYHPDKNDANADAGEKIKEINEAYTVLGNTEKRREYDFNCIINNHYSPREPQTAEPFSQKEPPVSSAHSADFDEHLHPEATLQGSNLHQQWKKVLWISIPVIIAIAVVYFSLPGKPVVPKTAVTDPLAAPAATDQPIAKNFLPASNAAIFTRWQQDKLLYKLDIWMPAGNKTPAEQSRDYFGDKLQVDFYDKDGFKIFNLPVPHSLNIEGWKRKDTSYMLTISDQVEMPLATYTALADWKIRSNDVPAVATVPIVEKAVAESAVGDTEIVIIAPAAAKKALKKPRPEKSADDILADETIRNGFKKNE